MATPRMEEKDKKLTPSESVAEIIRLCDEIDQAHRRSYKEGVEVQGRLSSEIRKIGQDLHEQGGEPLMLQVAQTVKARSRHGRFLEREWNGIGTWMG